MAQAYNMNNGDTFPATQVWQFTGTPGVTSDITQGFSIGDMWVTTTAPRGFYICLNNAAGAAVWSAKYV